MKNWKIPYSYFVQKIFKKKRLNWNIYMIETIKTNFQVYYKPNLICNAGLISECKRSHLLNCQKLIGSNELVTYIPNYEDIFDDSNLEEQFYMPV